MSDIKDVPITNKELLELKKKDPIRYQELIDEIFELEDE